MSVGEGVTQSTHADTFGPWLDGGGGLLLQSHVYHCAGARRYRGCCHREGYEGKCCPGRTHWYCLGSFRHRNAYVYGLGIRLNRGKLAFSDRLVASWRGLCPNWAFATIPAKRPLGQHSTGRRFPARFFGGAMSMDMAGSRFCSVLRDIWSSSPLHRFHYSGRTPE